MPAERIESVGEGPTDAPTDQETNPMAEMLDRYLSCRTFKHGEIVRGIVVRTSPNEIILDIGAKREGIVPQRDLERLSPATRDAIQVGDEVMVSVMNPENDNGNVTLSLSHAQMAQEWSDAQRLLKDQEITEGEVVAVNKGGVIVQIGGIRGFVPGSQLAASRAADQAAPDPGSNDRWASLIGESLQLKIIEVDQERNRLILSERAAMRDWRKGQRERFLNELTEGEVRRGKVVNLVDFGAFIDLGGIDGLVHLSELSWKRIAHPREVVEVGQEVAVYVLRIDRERQRVALSLKRLQPDPWISVEERYHEGQLVEGVITRLTKRGAFASIVGDEAIEGLIRLSEISDNPIVHPREILKPGQAVTLRVIDMDAAHHRLALSLKRVDEEEFRGEDWKAALETDQPEVESPLSAALSEAIEIKQEPSFQRRVSRTQEGNTP